MLQVPFAGAATLEARLNVVEYPLVRHNVFISDCNETRVANDVDVCFGSIQCDQFGPLAHAIRSRVHPGGLPPDFVDRRKAIKEQLPSDDGGFTGL